MCPILFKIGPVSIYAYGAMLAVSFLVVTFLTAKQAAKKGIKPDIIVDFLFWTLISGILGARLFYVILNINYYLNNPLEIIMLQRGGLVWYGGLSCAVVAGIYYLDRHNLDIGLVLDMTIPYVALGQAIGRVGCLLNGCCFGRPSAWGLYFAVHATRLIPVQLYSSLGLLIIFLILRFLEAKPHKKLEIFFLYLILHSLQRFFLQFLRADYQPLFLGLGIFQIISVLVFLIGASGLIITRCRQ